MGKVGEAESLEGFGTSLAHIDADSAEFLVSAIEQMDADGLECAFLLRRRFRLPIDPTNPDDPLPMLHRLLAMTWHREQEEIVQRLQHIAAPESIEPLKQAILQKDALSHLDYDDYGSYYKKCLWALSAIGTADALNLIKDCTAGADDALRREAEYRLVKIAQYAVEDAKASIGKVPLSAGSKLDWHLRGSRVSVGRQRFREVRSRALGGVLMLLGSGAVLGLGYSVLTGSKPFSWGLAGALGLALVLLSIGSQRLFPNHYGPMRIDPEDPLIKAATEQARSELPRFRSGFESDASRPT